MNVELRALSPADLRRLLAGQRTPEAVWHPEYPMEETFVAGQLTLDGSAGTDPAPWGMYQIVVDGRVVGDAGFHGPLGEDGTVEIGYNVVADQRGRGIASAACRALVDLAWQAGALHVLAETDQDNVASRQVLLKVGFNALRQAQGADRQAQGADHQAQGGVGFSLSRPAATA